MLRYFKLYLVIMRQSMLVNLEYRVNFLLGVVRNLGYPILAIFFFAVVFGNVKQVAGWQFYEVLLLYGTYQLVLNVLGMTVWGGLAKLSNKIRRGDLDTILVKPVHPQFAASLPSFYWDDLANFAAAFVIVGYALNNLTVLSAAAVFIYLLLVLVAVLGFYALFLVVTTLAFWWVDLYNLEALFSQVINLGRVPVVVYSPLLRFVLTFVIPVAFVGTVPAESLVRVVNWGIVIYGISLAVILLWLSNKFFHFGLKHYSSASS